MSALAIKPTAHVVDILGNVIGRDQPILRMEKALEMVSLLNHKAFIDENTIFFDPFCKAGELLLACAFHSCWEKTKLASKVLDMDLVFKEIYESNRYFGLSPDERHHKLSTRTFLGNTNSHDQKFNHIIRDGHYLSEKDGTLDKHKFEKEFNSMIDYISSKSKNKKIIAVGNPPYQEEDGGFGKSAKAVYGYFVDFIRTHDSISELIVVIPSRWFSGGKGLDQFRTDIIESNQVRNLRAFKNPREVFPTVDINGGVCFLHIDKSHEGDCRFIDGKTEVNVNLSDLDAIPDDLMAYSLIEKVRKKTTDKMSDYVMARNPFGITSTTLRNNGSSGKKLPCMIKERKIIQIQESLVLKNKHLINRWKVVVPAAVGGTKAVRDFLPVNQFFIVEPGIALAETYIIVGTFDTKADSEKLLSYLKTSFCRYFIGLRKLTQHLSKECWTWVPQVNFNKPWTDEDLFSFFGLTEKEQKHIIKTVKEWS